MKHIARLLALAVLLALPALALAKGRTACYWQLDSVTVSCETSPSALSASAETSAQSFASGDARAMMDALRGGYSLSLSLSREISRSSLGLLDALTARADYALGALPAIVPGGACARLNLSAADTSAPGSYYLYLTVAADGRRVVRVRGSGAWIARVSFPHEAVPGAQRRVTVRAQELNGLASVRIDYRYTAHAGAMLIDGGGDVVLLGEQGEEIARYPQTVADLLPLLAPGASSDGGTLFSAETQEDGALLVRLLPDSGLTAEEIIRLIRAARQAMQAAQDAQSMQSGAQDTQLAPSGGADGSLPESEADKDTSTLYLARTARGRTIRRRAQARAGWPPPGKPRPRRAWKASA